MSFSEQAASLSHKELVQSYILLSKQNTELEHGNTELAHHNAELEHHNNELGNQNAGLEQRNEELKQQNDWLRRQLFGKKSERRLPAAPEGFPKQLSLGEGYEPEDEPPPKKTTVKSYERSHRKDEVEFVDSESRLKFDENVPVEVVTVPNPATEGLSEDEYEVIGQEVSHKLAQRPGAYVVLKYVRPKV
jgi:hypothetical protein